MTEMPDWWIGDRLREQSTGVVGIFEGMLAGKAQVRIGEMVRAIDCQNLELATETEESIEMDADPISVFPPEIFETTLDLHLESLAPERRGDSPLQIRQFQRRSARAFLEKAIDLRIPRVLVIHGKGEGVLREDVLQLLRIYPEIHQVEQVHNGGAQEIRFRF